MKKATIAPLLADEQENELPLFSLDGLLPVGRALSVNTACLIVSLVSTNPVSGNPILLQRPLTELQMRILLPLLESPHYCSHEVLLASLFCSYRGLLVGFLPSQRADKEEWLAALQKTHLLLERAQEQGTWRKELKQLYNVLSELRSKLRSFGLGISICKSGSAYALMSRPASQQEMQIPPDRLPTGTASLPHIGS